MIPMKNIAQIYFFLLISGDGLTLSPPDASTLFDARTVEMKKSETKPIKLKLSART
jgi:hypothetical protein